MSHIFRKPSRWNDRRHEYPERRFDFDDADLDAFQQTGAEYATTTTGNNMERIYGNVIMEGRDFPFRRWTTIINDYESFIVYIMSLVNFSHFLTA